MARGLSNPKQIMLLACLLWQSHCYLPEAALYHPLVQPHLNNYQAQDPHHGSRMMKRKPKSTTSNCFCSSNWICKSGSFLLQPPFQLIIRINNLHGSVKQRISSPHTHPHPISTGIEPESLTFVTTFVPSAAARMRQKRFNIQLF